MAVVVLALLHLAPIWLFDFFPTQDGPSHLHNAHVLLAYDHPANTAYREYYALNLRPIPNLLGHLVLAGTMAVTPPRVAEKLFLSLVVLLTLVSLLYALDALRPGPSFAWLLPFPLLYGFPLHMGFYNFSLGVPISLFAVGYVLARPDGFTTTDALKLMLLLILAYFAHLLAWSFAIIAIGIVAAARLHRAAAATAATTADLAAAAGAGAAGAAAGGNRADAAGPAPDLGRTLREQGFSVLLAVSAVGVLAASYFLRGHFFGWAAAVGVLFALCGAVAAAATGVESGRAIASRGVRGLLAAPLLVPLAACAPAVVALALARSDPRLFGPVAPGPTLPTRLRRLWGIDALTSYSPLEILPAVATAALLLGIALFILRTAVLRRTPIAPHGGLGWATFAFVALYLAAPNGIASGGYILPRIALYSLFIAVLWLGAHRLSPALERLAGIGAVSIAVTFLMVRLPTYAEFEHQLSGLMEAAAPIEENTTLLGLSFAPFGLTADGGIASTRVKPLLHAAALVAAEKRLVLLNNYEAGHPDFPVRYRPEIDPTPHLGQTHYPRKARLDLLSYPLRTPGRIDYVLLWGLRPTPTPSAEHTLIQLDAAFDPIPTPSPTTRLYRARP
ncbi:MAG TPA: hypothetical protein VF212_08720 [Longimicrobiales bacterium]